MIEKQLSIPKSLLIFGIPVLIFASAYIIVNSATFDLNSSELAAPLTLDLLLTTPILYFFLIRKTKIPNLTVVPLFVIGLLIGYSVLPNEFHGTLDIFKQWVLPILEITVFTIVLLKIRKIRRSFKDNNSLDFYDALLLATNSEFPKKMAVAMSTEISAIYYGFIHWKKVHLKENQFSYHKNSGTPALLFALILIVAVEVFAMHIWIVNYSVVFAWILSALSIYSALQLFAFGKSLSKRPYRLDAKKLHLKYGILSSAIIDLNNIKEIEKSPLDIKLTADTKTLSPLSSIDAHNVMIIFNQPQIIQSLYGFEKEVKTLLIHVDEKDEFIQKIRDSLS
jgi:hypothetical protein